MDAESADQASMEHGEKPGEGKEQRIHPFYEPEYRALTETLVEYERASAEERIAAQVTRQKFDAMVACWHGVLHSILKQVGPIDPKAIHKVMDAMDNFLNRSGGKRR